MIFALESLLILMLAAFHPQQADTTGDELGVRKSIRIAVEHNPALQQIREQIDARKGVKRSSWGIDNPELIYMREGIDGSSFSEQRWQISQTIDFPLTSYYRVSKVQSEVDALKARYNARQLQLVAEVKKAYADLAYAIELFHLTNEQVKLARNLESAASTRYEVGESSQIDVMQAEVQLSEAQNDLSDAQRRIMNARYSLFNVIGLDPDQQRYNLEFPDTLAYVNIDINQDSVLSRLPDHPEIKLQNYRIDAARYGIREMRSSYLPKIRMDYYRQDFGNDYNFNGFEVGLRIPLWFAVNQGGQLQTAKANYREQKWSYQETFLRIKKLSEQAWHSYASSQSIIERYHTQIRTRSSELLDLTQEGYRAGEMDLLTLLQAQRTYLDSQRRYYAALHEYYLQLIELEKYLQADIVFATRP